jgi:glycine hydroxymethyltransferase
MMAAKAVALAEARTDRFRAYAQRVVDNAAALADGLLRRGITLVTGGTDNHLVLVNVTGFAITGRQAEAALLEAGIVVNRNAIPRDPNGAWFTSGIRLGTPALTTRGLGTTEMDQIAELIHTVLANTRPGSTPSGNASRTSHLIDPAITARIAKQASELVGAHPLYPTISLGMQPG